MSKYSFKLNKEKRLFHIYTQPLSQVYALKNGYLYIIDPSDSIFNIGLLK